VRSQAEVWRVSLCSILSINTSYSEVTMSRGVKGVIVLHPFNKYFIQLGTPFIPLLIVTSLYEVFIEWMEYDDTFHTSAPCDLTDWSIGVIILHPLNKYFIQWGHNEQRYERCHHTPSTQ
jgi:hypothetical protein